MLMYVLFHGFLHLLLPPHGTPSSKKLADIVVAILTNLVNSFFTEMYSNTLKAQPLFTKVAFLLAPFSCVRCSTVQFRGALKPYINPTLNLTKP